MPGHGSPEEIFLDQLESIERVIDSVCRRNGCFGEEAEEFSSWVKFRLMEDDYAILRKFRRRSRLSTYLTTVIHNLFRDFRIRKWGKWRPSAAARRLGSLGVQYEMLTSRDGLSFEEVCELLSAHHGSPTRERIEELAVKLPVRGRRRFESLDAVESLGSEPDVERRLEDRELRELEERTERALLGALAGLQGEDRLILKMRFEDGFTVAQIARTLCLEQRPLYTRFDRCLRKLREALEELGLGSAEVRGLLDWGRSRLTVDYGWESRGARPSNPTKRGDV